VPPNIGGFRYSSIPDRGDQHLLTCQYLGTDFARHRGLIKHDRQGRTCPSRQRGVGRLAHRRSFLLTLLPSRVISASPKHNNHTKQNNNFDFRLSSSFIPLHFAFALDYTTCNSFHVSSRPLLVKSSHLFCSNHFNSYYGRCLSFHSFSRSSELYGFASICNVNSNSPANEKASSPRDDCSQHPAAPTPTFLSPAPQEYYPTFPVLHSSPLATYNSGHLHPCAANLQRYSVRPMPTLEQATSPLTVERTNWLQRRFRGK
jgi:hypothetical protein